MLKSLLELFKPVIAISPAIDDVPCSAVREAESVNLDALDPDDWLSSGTLLSLDLEFSFGHVTALPWHSVRAFLRD